MGGGGGSCTKLSEEITVENRLMHMGKAEKGSNFIEVQKLEREPGR